MADNPQDMFGTVGLQRVLEISFVPQDFIWKTLFKETNKSQTEYIQVDKFKHSRKLSTFVSPTLEGQLVEKKGYTTDVLLPPYIKEKKMTQAYNLLKRPMGQNPYGPVKSPRAIAMEELGKDTAELKTRIFRLQEKMCNDVLLTGLLTANGPGVELSYDFNLPAANLWSVAGTEIPVAWSTSTADILADIENAGDLIKKNTGRMPNITIFGQNVYKFFRSNEDIRAILDNRRIISGEMKIDILPKGVTYIGNIGEMDYYQYVEYYEDDTGALVNMFNKDRVVVTSTDLRASMEYGPIQDLEFAGNIPVEVFLKSWMEKDPSGQVLLAQSSPLPVHHQMDGVVVINPFT